MSAIFEFETANSLSKFLSDKLRAHPGTTQSAKLMHWIAEFQGFRNTRAYKAAPSPALLREGVAMHLKPGQGMALGVGGIETRIHHRVVEMTTAFIQLHHQVIENAIRVKLAHPSYDLEEQLFQRQWEGEVRLTMDITDAEATVVVESLPAKSHHWLEGICRDHDKPVTPQNLAFFLYEETVKDVLVHVLRELTATCELEECTVDALVDEYELRTRIRSAADACVPKWLGG